MGGGREVGSDRHGGTGVHRVQREIADNRDVCMGTPSQRGGLWGNGVGFLFLQRGGHWCVGHLRKGKRESLQIHGPTGKVMARGSIPSPTVSGRSGSTTRSTRVRRAGGQEEGGTCTVQSTSYAILCPL